MGLLDGNYAPDPLAQGLLGLGSALMTPRQLGGGLMAGANAFNQGAMQAQMMRRQMAQDAERSAMLRERSDMDRKRFGFEVSQAEAQAADRERQRGVLQQVRSQIEQQNPALLPLFDTNPQAAMERLFPKAPEAKVVAPGSVLVRGSEEIYRAPERPPQAPWEYEPDPANPGRFRMRPEVLSSKTQVAKSGATNIGLPRIEVKAGDSMAGQIGTMLRDSKIATEGAVNMADSAQRALAAIEKGGVIAGPTASLRLRGAQVASMLGIGGKDAVAQTRQVIRSLAESSIEARKELQGQGQVTENEAKAVQKAMSGDIDDLTVDEIRDIAKLNLRAATLRVQRHQQMIESVPESAGALRPFYNVPRAADVMRIDPSTYSLQPPAPVAPPAPAGKNAVTGTVGQPGQSGWSVRKLP